MQLRTGILSVIGAATLLAAGVWWHAHDSTPVTWTQNEIDILRSLWLGNLPKLPPDPTNAVADDLQIMINAGHQYVKLQTVADMWAGDDKGKVWVWNPRLRKLKKAIDAGEIDYLKQGNSKPSKRTDA